MTIIAGYHSAKLGMHNAVLHLQSGEEVQGRIFALPLSISEDRRQMVARNGRWLCNTKAYASILNRQRAFLAAGVWDKFTEPQCILMASVFPDSRSRDVSNYEKSVFDAMTASRKVWEDDSHKFFPGHVHFGYIIPHCAFHFGYILPAPSFFRVMAEAQDIFNDTAIYKAAERVHHVTIDYTTGNVTSWDKSDTLETQRLYEGGEVDADRGYEQGRDTEESL